MKPVYTRIIIVVLIVGIFIGMTQCYDKKACEQVLDVATVFSQALVDHDCDKVLELSSSKYKPSNTKWYFERWDCEEKFGAEKAEVLDFIQKSITFEIRPGTVDASTKDEYAEVDVYFSMVDYDHVYSDTSNLTNFSMLMRELRSEDGIKTFRVTIKLVYEDEQWLVSNFDDAYKALYSFYDLNVSFPNSVRSAVLGGNWCFTVSAPDDKNHRYENTSVIDMDLVLSPDVPNVDWSGVYYTVSLDGELLYTSEPGMLEGYYGEDQEAEFNDDGYLVPGEYTISFYDQNDYLLFEDTAIVDIVYVDQGFYKVESI